MKDEPEDWLQEFCLLFFSAFKPRPQKLKDRAYLNQVVASIYSKLFGNHTDKRGKKRTGKFKRPVLETVKTESELGEVNGARFRNLTTGEAKDE